MPLPADLEHELARAVSGLEALGARGFDADGCDAVRSLIERAGALPPAGRALLLERAALHLERLQRRFEQARDRVQLQLSAAEERAGSLPRARAALERGEFQALRGWLARTQRPPLRPLRDQAERRRCASLYEGRRMQVATRSSLARAVELLPEHAGPYNPLRIASDLLERIRAVSPAYLDTQLIRFLELASLMTLPEPLAPERAKKTRARSRRGPA